MPATFLVDLKNVAVGGVSVLPQTIGSATTVNGDAIDMQLSEGPIHLVVVTGDCGDSTLTLDAKLQESVDGSNNFTDVTDGAMAQLAGATGGDKKMVVVSTAKRTKRYVRAVVTTAGGGTLSAPVAALVLGRKKISGTGTGTSPT
jgi:hypothetical protein